MSEFQFDLEVSAYFEAMKIMAGKSTPGMSSSFVESAKEWKKSIQELDTIPTTPEELGWTKDAGD